MRGTGVVRVEIERRLPMKGEFGAAGAFELVLGRYHGALDPRDPKNVIITDLALAPRNTDGYVEYEATFAIAKPVDMAKASGLLVYDVPNRGFGVDLHSGHGPGFGTASGDADGHVHVISGWQGDIPPGPPMQTIRAPVATHPDGSPVTGRVLIRFVNPPAGAVTLPLSPGLGGTAASYAPLTLDTADAQLARRRSDDEPAEVLPDDAWAFADCREAPFPGQPDARHISLKGGFDPAYAYELTYTAKDPRVLGIGFAAVRDLVAFLRDEPGTEAAPNPVAGAIGWTIATGASQSGNFLRSFTHLGFNQALSGKRVFDGLNVFIAGRHVPLNVRFGAPGGAAGLYEPGSEGVLWWGPHEDRVRGRPAASLLDRCRATDTCPKVFEMFGSAEIWGLRMSPDLVGLEAEADIPLPSNVRRYYFPGVTHAGGQGGFETAPAKDGVHALAPNPNPCTDTVRALLKAMAAWVMHGAEPPPSRYPTLAAGDLVEPTAAAMGHPTLPGQPAPDGKLNPMAVYDFGPGFHAADESGVMDRVPPVHVATATSLVPRVDADGNETSGIPSVQMRAPLGTYLGWNVHAGGYFAGRSGDFAGGFIPFATTRAERLEANDPRPSLDERYATHAGFVARVRDAAAAMVSEGFLLAGDAERIVAEAKASGVLR